MNASGLGTFNLNEILDHAALTHPVKDALVMDDRRLSYDELRREVLAAALGFDQRGIARGDRVAIVLRNGFEFVVSYFALVRLGAVAVPINFMIQKEEELAYLLSDSRAKGIVVHADFLPGVRKAAARASIERLWIVGLASRELRAGEEEWRALTERGFPVEFPAVGEEEPAAILYTSGTTGNPKGAVLSHKNIASNALSGREALGLSSSDVFLVLLPMFHSFSWTANVVTGLALGAKLVVCESVTPAKPWLAAMSREGVTLFSAIPPVYALLSREARGVKGFFLRHWFFRKVRMAISGAAPLGLSILADFERALGVPLLEGYGLTETSPVVSVNTLKARKPGSVGPLFPGVEVQIWDESGAPLPPEAEGEVAVRGNNVMLGYFGNPQATAEAITPEGWFRTGDIGVLDSQGFLFIRDRKKDMIIVKGLKVFPAQVESVLQTHPAVEEAAVVGLPSGQGNEIIQAFVVLKRGAQADKASLLAFCREKLDPYKRPRDVEILASLPKNSIQKVLKRELRDRYLEGAARSAAGAGP